MAYPRKFKFKTSSGSDAGHGLDESEILSTVNLLVGRQEYNKIKEWVRTAEIDSSYKSDTIIIRRTF